MPSETFYCPRCNVQLTKSAQAYVLGEMVSNKESSFIALGEMAETVTCPSCGVRIDAIKMVLGEYDAMGGKTSLFGNIVGLVAFAVIVFYLDIRWWIGAICGVVLAMVVEEIWQRLRAK